MNGTTTISVTDADNREVLEYDGSSGQILGWYAYSLGLNDILNQMNVVAGNRATLVIDIQGSVVATLDSGTGSLTKFGYLPYGKSASAPAQFGYTGQRIDTETNGLYYYRARHYSPVLGRFLQSDPLGYKGGANLYAYAGSDPLNAIDPTGLTSEMPVASPITVPASDPATVAAPNPVTLPPSNLAPAIQGNGQTEYQVGNPFQPLDTTASNSFGQAFPGQQTNGGLSSLSESIYNQQIAGPVNPIIPVAGNAPSTPCTGGLCSQGGSYGNGGVIPHPLTPGQFLCPACALKLFDLDLKDPNVRKLLDR